MNKSVMRVYYGDGKGKTASAIGQAVLAASEGQNVIIVQFLKCRNENEMSFINRMEPEIKLFRFEKSDACFADLTPHQQEEESINLRNGMNFARKVLTTGECSLLILDEVLGVLENGIISLKDLEELKSLADETEVLLTGTHCPKELMELADEVYCLEAMK